MNFNLSEEHQMLKDTLNKYLKENYNNEFRNELSSGGESYSKRIWGELAELGIIGALFSEDDGGFGGKSMDIAIVFEELGKAGALEPFLATGILGGGLLADLGNEQQKQLIEQIISGDKQFAFAHGEPQSRYDLNKVATTSTEQSGSFILNGNKSLVINGLNADYFIVSARTSGKTADTDGISLFLVDSKTKGISTHPIALANGTRACNIVLDSCEVAKESLLGTMNSAFDTIEKHVARAIAALCCEAVGAMDSSVELTINYLKDRKQFGLPLGKFQALQHRMADLLIEVEQARSATINLLGHLEAEGEVRETYVSAAKNLIGRVGRKISEESIQLHGGMGMTQEYPLAYFAKRLVMIDHQFGDTDHHLERFMKLKNYA